MGKELQPRRGTKSARRAGVMPAAAVGRRGRDEFLVARRQMAARAAARRKPPT